MELNYKMLVEELLYGREFEFKYGNKVYCIVTDPKGKILCSDNKRLSLYYSDIRELLDKVKIEGKSIEEIFNTIKTDGSYYLL